MKREPRVYGLLAEFPQPENLLAAATAARAAGYRRMDAYTPFPVHGLSEAIGFHTTEQEARHWNTFFVIDYLKRCTSSDSSEQLDFT